jgi:opacity protein-like surface antigen
MRFKLAVFPLLAVSFLTIAVSAFSQVVPSYERKSGWPFTIGAGPVNYDVDIGHGRMYGFAGWFDIYPGKLPSILHGHLGAEGELREIRFGASSSQPNVRYDTAAMGLIYTWNRLHNIRPYAKCLIGDGSVDWPRIWYQTYAHDTRTFTAPGGGLEFRVKQDLWIRADYEYQMWQSLVFGSLKPQGFTLGASYDFTHPFLLKNRQ